MRFKLLGAPARFIFLHQVRRTDHLRAGAAHQLNRPRIHHRHIGDRVLWRILHRHALRAAKHLFQIFSQFVLRRIIQRLPGQGRQRLRLYLVHQFLWRALGRNEVKPPSRPHSLRQAQDILRDRIASAKIIEEPAIDPGGPQIALDFLNICAHRGISSITRTNSFLKLQASCASSARICCRVTPRISMRFVRLLSPPRILTADLGFIKSWARNSTSASFARSSTAGARSRTLNAPPISPAISSLLARGCTLTEKVTAPSRSWTSTIRLLATLYFAWRTPKSAVPTRTSVAPSSI